MKKIDKNKKAISLKGGQEINEFIYYMLGRNNTRTSLKDLKTTITVNLGTKKRLEKLNVNNLSHDALLNNLITELIHLRELSTNIRNEVAHNKNNSAILLKVNEISRVKKVMSYMNYKITFSYNKYIGQVEDFEFYLTIEGVRYKGKKIDLDDYYLRLSRAFNNHFHDSDIETNKLYGEVGGYFLLLSYLIETAFNLKPIRVPINSLCEPLYWEFALSKLKLPKKVIINDIKNKASEFDIKLLHKKQEEKKNGNSK